MNYSQQSLVNHCTGFSLIELMIAITLALVLMTGAGQFMLSSRQTYALNDDMSRIQENGRIALDLIVSDMRMTGYRDPRYRGNDREFIQQKACGGFDPCTEDNTTTFTTVPSDRLALAMDIPTPPLSVAPDIDCTGVSLLNNSDIIANVYWVQVTPATQISSLYCRGYNITQDSWLGVAQPLVDGIDSMHVLYGVESTADNGVTQYFNRDRVPNWTLIKTIRIAFLVSNGSAVGGLDAMVRNYSVLDSGTMAFNDRHQRQIYSTTIHINN